MSDETNHPRSSLYDLIGETVPAPSATSAPPVAEEQPAPRSGPRAQEPETHSAPAPGAHGPEESPRDPGPVASSAPEAAPQVAAPRSDVRDEARELRRAFRQDLGEFRRSLVLIPLDGNGAPLAGEYGGIQWLYAFSDEHRFVEWASLHGAGDREWDYHTVYGARLLDVGVPLVGEPCGVALDVASEDGMLFPPVQGVVPDAVAVDGPEQVDHRRTGHQQTEETASVPGETYAGGRTT